MKREISILVIGTHPQILAVIIRLLNARENWTAKGVSSLQELVKLCRIEEFQVILLGAGLAASEEERIKHFAAAELPGTAVVTHYGGGSGLLYQEITSVLNQ